MALQLPIVNGSSGVWGTMLNTALTDLDTRTVTSADKDTTHDTEIENLKTRIKTLEESPASKGMLITCTSSTRPPAAVGQIVLETDTGFLYYVQNVNGSPTRLPWPGSTVLRARNTVAINIPTGGTGAAIRWDLRDFDRLGGWNGTTRYTCQVKGNYQFTGAASFVNNTTGVRLATWNANGVAVNASRGLANPVSGYGSVVPARPTVLSLNVGDYVELWGYQTSGVTLATETSGSWQSDITVSYTGYSGS